MHKSLQSFDDVDIKYVINKGTTPYFVFVHGVGSNHTTWGWLLNLLPKKTSYIAIDNRNHGRSSRGMFTIDNCARDIKAVLDKEKIVQPIMVGLCFGSAIVAEYCRLFPDNVKKAVLVSPFGRDTIWLPRIVSWINWVFLKVAEIIEPKRKPGFINYVTSNSDKMPIWKYPFLDMKYNQIKDYLKGVQMSLDYKFDLQNITIPLLVVHGSKDIFTSKDAVHKVFKNHSLIEINSTHWVSFHSPEELYNIISKRV
jgi:3-oxoadipate enol-lactonase